MRKKKALYNVSFSLLLQLIVIIYGFIVPKIIIAKYGSDVNGLISSITNFLMYISLLESGVGPVIKSALYKPLAKKDKYEIANIINKSNQFFKIIAKIFILYIIVLLIFYPLFVNSKFNYLYIISLILIISISTFAEYYFGMTYKLFLQADQKSYVISAIQIVTYVMTCIAIIIMAKLNFSIHIIKLISSLIFVLRPIVQNLYVRKKYKIQFDKYDKKYELKQKWDGLAQHIASVVHNNTDVAVITIFSTLQEVSVYSVYYLIVKGVKSVIQAITNGLDASFGDMIAKDEQEVLNNRFSLYEFIYFIIISIIYACSIVMIVPFVKVYTLGITDVNYIRPLFGSLLVISELIWSIRLPYSSITLAAGHFKETKKGAWVEAMLNILISIIFVHKFGIIGVAIGTLVAMLTRTIEFIYHSNKYILKRGQFKSVTKILLLIIEIILIIFLSDRLFIMNISNYIEWIKYATIIFFLSCIIVIPLNILFQNNEFKEFINILKKLIRKKD